MAINKGYNCQVFNFYFYDSEYFLDWNYFSTYTWIYIKIINNKANTLLSIDFM